MSIKLKILLQGPLAWVELLFALDSRFAFQIAAALFALDSRFAFQIAFFSLIVCYCEFVDGEISV